MTSIALPFDSRALRITLGGLTPSRSPGHQFLLLRRPFEVAVDLCLYDGLPVRRVTFLRRTGSPSYIKKSVDKAPRNIMQPQKIVRTSSKTSL